jgi:hypothetical protein
LLCHSVETLAHIVNRLHLMKGIKTIRYDERLRESWNSFVRTAKNGLFLFDRSYMEYHSDRFKDYSLLFMDEREHLIALLPANLERDVLVSHAGLTFGGIISDTSMKTPLMLEMFDSLFRYLRREGVKRLVYKSLPYIYHRVPAGEDLYALYRHGAKLSRRDVSSAIYLSEKLPFNKGRKWMVKKGRKFDLKIGRDDDIKTFMGIEERLLSVKYGVTPAHSASEMRMLADRFPDNIKLFTARREGEMLAGVLIYESHHVSHAQYISATEEGKQIGALDLILDFLINDHYTNKRYFDFGISTEDNGRQLNQGLIGNKEGFGARAIVHDFYELDLEAAQ